MNILEKIGKSLWVILSFIIFLNGFGFIYIGFKHDNRNWILEGITYEIPWFFYFIVYASFNVHEVSFNNPTAAILSLAIILMLVSIIRSIWVAVKLVDVYENNEKYTIQQTNLNTQTKTNKNNSNSFSCCMCLLIIFFIFALIAIF